jgi:WD40 repeat protein
MKEVQSHVLPVCVRCSAACTQLQLYCASCCCKRAMPLLLHSSRVLSTCYLMQCSSIYYTLYTVNTQLQLLTLLVCCMTSYCYINYCVPLCCVPPLPGHCKDELWGLDTAPCDSPDLFVTAGDDATVRVWSMSEKRMLCCTRVNERARAVAWDPTPGGGGLLAVRLKTQQFCATSLSVLAVCIVQSLRAWCCELALHTSVALKVTVAVT